MHKVTEDACKQPGAVYLVNPHMHALQYLAAALLLPHLRSQLAHTRQQLMQEGAAREKLEENMKQAFMRGEGSACSQQRAYDFAGTFLM